MTVIPIPNPFVAKLFVSIFRQLKLELQTQFPASIDEMYLLYPDNLFYYYYCHTFQGLILLTNMSKMMLRGISC